MNDITQECQEWDGALDAGGYGRKRVNGKPTYMHRLVWAEEHGPIPQGLVVRHKCDNPPCILPDHLQLGTHADNLQDTRERGQRVSVRHEICRNGHRITGEGRQRHCRTCKRIRDRVRNKA